MILKTKDVVSSRLYFLYPIYIGYTNDLGCEKYVCLEIDIQKIAHLIFWVIFWKNPTINPTREDEPIRMSKPQCLIKKTLITESNIPW